MNYGLYSTSGQEGGQVSGQEGGQVGEQVSEQVSGQVSGQASGQVSDQVSDQEGDQVSDQENLQTSDYDNRMEALLEFCATARTRNDMQEFIGISSRRYFRINYLNPLLDAGKLQMTIPDNPNNRNQRYIRT
jgi:ATP-dependent DNA helicase RecG